MQKPKFDLRRLRAINVQDLRDRARRLRNIQALGDQVTRLRQRRFHAEYLVPLAALLLLVLALIISYAPATPLVVERSRPTTVVANIQATSAARAPTLATAYPTASGINSGNGYPAGTATPGLPTTGALSGAPETMSTTPISGTPAYPGPSAANNPAPIGTPIAGGIGPASPTGNPPGAPAPTPALGGPSGGSSGSFVTPVVPVNPGNTGSGYPGPSVSIPSGPNPGVMPGPALIPTNPPPAGPPLPPLPPRRSPPPPPAVVTPASRPAPTSTARRGSGSGTGGNSGSGYPGPANNGGAASPSPQSRPRPPAATIAPAATSEPGATSGPVVAPTQPRAPASPRPSSPPATSTTAPAPPTPAPPPPPTPTAKPVGRVQGRWAAAQSPIIVDKDAVVPAGAALQIDPGVEVRLNPGVDLVVEGQLRAAGTPGAPVRFTGPNGRWGALIGQPGSAITLENTQVRGGGSGGTAISSGGGQLMLRNVLLTDGGGGIWTSGATIDIRGSQITGNDLGGTPALNAQMSRGTGAALYSNIFGGNRTARGTPQVRLIGGDTGSGPLDAQGNAFTSSGGALLVIETKAPLGGTIRCNGFRGGTVGLQFNASTASAKGFALAVDTNAFEQQSSYGAASTIALGTSNNWWGDPSGPADAARNPQGRGVRIGVNVTFQPWLPARPTCAPTP